MQPEGVRQAGGSRPRQLRQRLLAAIAYYILQSVIIAQQGRDSRLAAFIGRDFKGKLSPVLYAIAIAASFFRPRAAGGIYVFVALMWLIPDRRIERVVDARE